jgi:parallel beta-helix repeat protein
MRRTIVLLATMALTLLVASGVALAVTKIGSAGAQSSVVGPGESIQKAVNAAHPGDTIVVRGVHREDVVIRKNGIKLRGDDAVIEAPTRARADSPCSKVFGPEAICVLGAVNLKTATLTGSRVRDVSISGFTIRGFNQKPNKGIASTIVIDVWGARNATVEGNHVVGNLGAGIGIDGDGLNNTIRNNDLTDNKDDGVWVAEQRNATIANNTLKGNADNLDEGGGIDLQTNTNTLIKGNDVRGGSTSIWTEDSGGTTFLSNTLRRYDDTGILVGGPKVAKVKVVGNDISGGDLGINVINARRGSFVGNQIHNNCAGLFFRAGLPDPVGNYEVKGNTVENNTHSCRAAQSFYGENFSGIGIALLGARDMELTGNHLSGNVPSGPTPVSGGVVVSTDPFGGGTTKPRDNSIFANDFGRNKPDIFFDKSGTGNRFRANNCNTSIPASLCN